MQVDRFALFEDVKNKVKAYKSFLKENKAFDVKNWEDIPIITKENYLLKYPLTETIRENDFDNCFLIGASSGFSKTGAVFWPKRAKDEADYLKIVEESLKNMYKIDKKKTLIIVSLAFGTWIGGMQLACAMRQLAAQSDYPLTSTLPGLDLEEGAYIARQFKDNFEQIIWITNASNVTIIYSLLKDDKDLTDGRIFFPVVGEYFSESYREDMAVKFGHKKEKEFFLWT
jgi:phenylacetate-CoA ligase